MSARLIAAVVVVCLGHGTSGIQLRDNEMIIGGGSAETDGMWISGPSLWLRRGTAGVAVGMVRPPGRKRQFAYVLVIKGDELRRSLAGYSSNSSSTGSAGNSSGFVEIMGKKATFRYVALADRPETGALRESLTLNGQTLDLAKGRVVLVDLSGEAPCFRQVSIDLPESTAWPAEPAEVETQAKELLDRLRRP